MKEKPLWLALSYTIPMHPSGSRVYVWRKLREIGAEYLRQGVALLPTSRSSLHKLQLLRDRILALEGGEAVITELRFLEEQDNRRMIETFRKRSLEEYRELMEQADSLDPKALRKRLAKVKSRDFFAAVEELGSGDIVARLVSGLDVSLDGGWSELVGDVMEIGRMITGAGPGSGEDKKQ